MIGKEIFEIISIGLLAFSFIFLIYYYLLMTFVLLNKGKFRFIEMRFPGAAIKDFVEIARNEKDQIVKEKYIKIHNGLKLGRRLLLAVVAYLFIVLLLFY